ncbi:MAG: aminopeptidase N [Burkholderiales bacterium]|nr:aminopeptidase N [Burkholderiales bacterium]
MSNKTIKYLKDYTPTDYLVDKIDMIFTINLDQTVQVDSTTTYYKNPLTNSRHLILDGSAQLLKIKLDGTPLAATEYSLSNDQLIPNNLPDKFELSITTLLYPFDNKTCMGLFASDGNLITQCEPEGFRKITYYPDRPDILATFSTTILNKNPKFTTFLSNGNNMGNVPTNPEDGIIHKVIWHDPFKKPCYLFALVVGAFAVLKDTFTTKSQRTVNLEIYVEESALPRCTHAMHSLKRAMFWDEQRFNLEYDLDTYMIVASSDFNMGAMENKGLNVFNTKYILADKDTATDIDFINVEAVIAHEYFHNWTGNRVTCRDWFQLSLKEGLTVFRDHQFTADLHNQTVKRIQEVKLLRQAQFPEDSGPLAHSVRPSSYIEIDNFYTMTVYEKGAEVVRMYQTILGNDGFNRGLDLYLKTNDGRAATCEDFCHAMSAANNFDLNQFMLWYSQAGTPHVKVSATYNSRQQEYQLTFEQSLTQAANEISVTQPMLIPVKMGLIARDGYEIPNIAPQSGRYVKHNNDIVLLLDNKINTFVFENIKQHPLPSLFREFSAPVTFDFAYTIEDRFHLVNYDNDEFNRWDNFQTILQQKIIQSYKNALAKDLVIDEDPEFWGICKNLINNVNLSPEFRAILFQLPTFPEMSMLIPEANPQLLALVLSNFTQQIGEKLFDSWMELYNLHLSLSLNYDFNQFGKRNLKNTALFYALRALSNKVNNPSSLQLIETLALGQYHNAHNMTDSFAVLAATMDIDAQIREQVLNEFYAKWKDNELVLDKWFAIQASSQLITTEALNKLMVNEKFIATNPNKIYALLRTFTTNGLKFHTEEGYSFIADKIITIDKFNPHLASVLTQGFNNTVYLSANHKKLARITLNRILEQPQLSPAVKEMAEKIISGLS